MSMSRSVAPGPSTSIIDILDRVLDKGLVVAGDISISLANVELLTIRIRLLVCSIDKAEQIGLNWWRYDRNLVAPATASAAGSGVGEGAGEIKRLEQRIADLERTLKSATPKR
ncbi:MAG TPA: gas vesicle protein [Candidatus Limnocylindria bacterium]|jgi:hypothetical protein